MNKELIQKLFSKSCWDEQAEVDIEDFISVEKFALLIARECGNVAWQHTPETEELEYSHLIKDKILERFGVLK